MQYNKTNKGGRIEYNITNKGGMATKWYIRGGISMLYMLVITKTYIKCTTNAIKGGVLFIIAKLSIYKKIYKKVLTKVS